MDPPQNPPQQEICEEHNQPVVFYQPNPNNNREALCVTCLQKLAGLIPSDTFQQIQKLKNQSKLQNNQDKAHIDNIVNSITEFKKSFNNSLEKIIKIMSDQIESIHLFMKKLENIFDDQFNQLVLEQMQKEFEDQKQSNQSIINIAKQELQDLKQDFSNMDILFTSQMESIIKQPIQLKEGKAQISDLLLSEQGNILVEVNYGEIYVYQFECGIVSKQLQKLTHNDYYAYCVNFMKNSNQLVSCGKILDKKANYFFPLEEIQMSIVIWERNTLKYEWFAKHQLKLQKVYFGICTIFDFSIIMNNQEDLLIAKNSNVVSFWRKSKSWLQIDQWKCEQIINTLIDSISLLSLNDSENTIIIGAQNQNLHILKLQNNKRWEDIQVIKGQFSSPCFTIDDKFLLEVYDYDNNLKQFAQFKKIKVDFGEPKFWNVNYFIKSKSILAIAFGNLLNIFKVDKGYNYQLIQKFQLNDQINKYYFSDSGEYLMVWNEKQKQIQVMKLKYLE